ncbi:hypothetical protein [Streptomyces sp. NPDC024089]|uniref:hypothetical protein n=1 Tax=Streptomyces sp. NPDC024089 TaxID=3154328 RepID=UPI0034056B75
MKLVLWDIDHTLIATHGVGRELFGKCFEHVTGVRMEQQAAVDGMTEPMFFRGTACLHGITSDRAMFEASPAAPPNGIVCVRVTCGSADKLCPVPRPRWHHWHHWRIRTGRGHGKHPRRGQDQARRIRPRHL